MDEDRRIQLLADQAESVYKLLTDHVFRHTTIQLVLLGWVLTSTSARDRVASFPSWGQLGLAVLPVGYSVMVWMIYSRLARRSRGVMQRVEELDKQLHADLQIYAVSDDWWIGMVVVHATLTLVFLVLILV